MQSLEPSSTVSPVGYSDTEILSTSHTQHPGFLTIEEESFHPYTTGLSDPSMQNTGLLAFQPPVSPLSLGLANVIEQYLKSGPGQQPFQRAQQPSDQSIPFGSLSIDSILAMSDQVSLLPSILKFKQLNPDHFKSFYAEFSILLSLSYMIRFVPLL